MAPHRFPFLVGLFLTSIFLLVGIAGSAFTVPKLLRWRDAANWTRTPATILSGEIRSVNSFRGGKTVRPHFTWAYEWEGKARTGEGFGVAEITDSNLGRAEEVIARHPPGSLITILVNPARPDESVVSREPLARLAVLLVPPAFAVLGVLGLFFSVTGQAGWYATGTRNPFGRLLRRGMEGFLKPPVLVSFVVGTFSLIMAGLVWWSIAGKQITGVVIALILGYGLWQATRQKRGTRPRPSRRS